jgi:hypothetical protein
VPVNRHDRFGKALRIGCRKRIHSLHLLCGPHVIHDCGEQCLLGVRILSHQIVEMSCRGGLSVGIRGPVRTQRPNDRTTNRASSVENLSRRVFCGHDRPSTMFRTNNVREPSPGTRVNNFRAINIREHRRELSVIRLMGLGPPLTSPGRISGFTAGRIGELPECLNRDQPELP